MSNFKPTICGDNNLTIPEGGCSDCEWLEERVGKLEECCAEAQDALDDLERRVTSLEGCCSDVREDLDSKLEASNIIAGDNITIEDDGEGNILISSTGGGGCSCTKAQILSILGYQELPMTLTDIEGNSREWTILGKPIT